MKFSSRSNILMSVLVLLILSMSITEVSAQRSRKKRSSRRTQQVTKPLAEQWYAIHMGNLNIGTTINLAGKFTYGFEFENRFSIGPSAKVDYQYINFRSPTPDISTFTYGGAVMARAKLFSSIYAMGEYGYTSFGTVSGSTKLREGHWYPAVGGGYSSGMGDWSYGIHILFPLKDRVRDFVTAEYWIDFNYKF